MLFCALQIISYYYYYYYYYWIIVNRDRNFTHLALWSSLFSLSNLTAASQISSLFGLAWNARDRICRAWYISPYNEESNWHDGKEHFKDETRKKTSILKSANKQNSRKINYQIFFCLKLKTNNTRQKYSQRDFTWKGIV